MEILLGIVVLLQLGIIIWLAKRPPRIIERETEKEKSLELQIRLADYQRQKEKEIDRQLTEEQKMRYDEINKSHREKMAQIDIEINSKRESILAKLNQEIEIYNKNFEYKKNELALNYQKFQDDLNKEFSGLEETKLSIQKDIEEWRGKHSAVIQTFKNIEEINNAENFHKIILSPDERFELDELNAAIRHLKNPMPFYKAIYDIYYKNKVNDLVLRVVGSERVSGIYKITHISSGKTYVGQSVDIGERWKQHAKRGCGADVLTQNKLYPAMMEHGIDKFMFEIVDTTTDTAKLNEMEKYWQNFFQSKEFGYSMK